MSNESKEYAHKHALVFIPNEFLNKTLDKDVIKKILAHEKTRILYFNSEQELQRYYDCFSQVEKITVKATRYVGGHLYDHANLVFNYQGKERQFFLINRATKLILQDLFGIRLKNNTKQTIANRYHDREALALDVYVKHITSEIDGGRFISYNLSTEQSSYGDGYGTYHYIDDDGKNHEGKANNLNEVTKSIASSSLIITLNNAKRLFPKKAELDYEEAIKLSKETSNVQLLRNYILDPSDDNLTSVVNNIRFPELHGLFKLINDTEKFPSDDDSNDDEDAINPIVAAKEALFQEYYDIQKRDNAQQKSNIDSNNVKAEQKYHPKNDIACIEVSFGDMFNGKKQYQLSEGAADCGNAKPWAWRKETNDTYHTKLIEKQDKLSFNKQGELSKLILQADDPESAEEDNHILAVYGSRKQIERLTLFATMGRDYKARKAQAGTQRVNVTYHNDYRQNINDSKSESWHEVWDNRPQFTY